MSAIGFGVGGLMSGLANGMRTGIGLRNFQEQQKLRQQQYEVNQIRLNALKRKAVEASDLANIRQSGVQTFDNLLKNGQVDTSQFPEYFRKNTIPKMYDAMVAAGDVNGANALKKWGDTEEAQHIAETRGIMGMQLHHALATGDFSPLNQSVRKEWNGLPQNLTEGATFKRIQKGKNGQFQAVFSGPNGKQFVRNWPNQAAFLDSVGRWLDPTLLYHYETQQAATAPLVTAELGGNGAATPTTPASPAPNPNIAATVFNPTPESDQSPSAVAAATPTPREVAANPAPTTTTTPSPERPLASVAPAPTTQMPAEAPSVVVPTTTVTHAVPEPVPTGAGAINGSTAPEEAAAFSAAPTEAPPAQGNVETVKTQPAEMAGSATPAAAEPAQHSVVVPPEVNDAIIRAYATGDKNLIGLANKVFQKYNPKYTLEKMPDGSIVAVNPYHPSDAFTSFAGAGDGPAALRAMGISEAQAHMLARYYERTGKFPNLGFGQQANAAKLAITALATNMAADDVQLDRKLRGLPPLPPGTELNTEAAHRMASLQAAYQGTVSGARSVGTRGANVQMAGNLALTAIPAALDASKAISRTRWTPVNAALLKAYRAGSSVSLSRWDVANLQIAEMYARALNPTGTTIREDMFDRAVSVLSQAKDPAAYRETLKTIYDNIKREQGGINVTEQEQEGQHPSIQDPFANEKQSEGNSKPLASGTLFGNIPWKVTK